MLGRLQVEQRQAPAARAILAQPNFLGAESPLIRVASMVAEEGETQVRRVPIV